MHVVPLTKGRWDDFVDLFTRPGPRGGRGPGSGAGCWCMWWRDRRDAETNRLAMEALVRRGSKPGLLAFEDRRAVGWISVAPRESYSQLMRSRDYKPHDEDTGVWSIVCLYVHPTARHRDVANVLLERAIAYAFENGATAVEAYPATMVEKSDYMGSLPTYSRLGFEPVREASTRTIVRLARPRGMSKRLVRRS